MMTDLLPCPFCGGKPVWQLSAGGQAVDFSDLHRINCSECYRIDMPYWTDKIDCIKQWNARHPDVVAQGTAKPTAWMAEYDGYFSTTTSYSTMCQWRDTLGRKITPLYAAPPAPHAALDVGEVQRQFYDWWKDHQEDPAHGMITQNCALATWHGAYDKYVRAALQPEAPAPVLSGQNSREELHKQYAKDWQRQIISAGGDENVALQAVTLAALNGLFDHLSTSNSPGANATEGQNG